MLGDVDHCTSVNHWLDPRLGSVPIGLYKPRQSEVFGTHRTFHRKQGFPFPPPRPYPLMVTDLRALLRIR